MADLRLQVIRDDHPDNMCGWELRIMVDGSDITARGCGMDPDDLLPAGLAAGAESHREVVVRCGCSVVGCGSTSVLVVPDGDTVLWTQWESDQGGEPLGDLRFDAADYDAEVHRAHGDREWEPEVRRVARQARAFMTEEVVAALEQHGLRSPNIYGTDRGTVEVWMDTGAWEHGHWQVWLDVTGKSPEAIGRLLADVPPWRWNNITWFPNDAPASSSPPPMAGKGWRRSPYG